MRTDASFVAEPAARSSRVEYSVLKLSPLQTLGSTNDKFIYLNSGDRTIPYPYEKKSHLTFDNFLRW